MEWEKIGEVDVDAGMVMIGDPCYVLHTEAGKAPEALKLNWGEFCKAIDDDMEAQDWKQLNHDCRCGKTGEHSGHEGLAVLVHSGDGDGNYPVYVKKRDGRVRALMVDFDAPEDEEDDER